MSIIREKIEQGSNMGKVGGIEKKHILKALVAVDGGAYAERTAKNIIAGSQEMKDLKKAMMMKNNYKIECEFWETIYKIE